MLMPRTTVPRGPPCPPSDTDPVPYHLVRHDDKQGGFNVNNQRPTGADR